MPKNENAEKNNPCLKVNKNFDFVKRYNTFVTADSTLTIRSFKDNNRFYEYKSQWQNILSFDLQEQKMTYQCLNKNNYDREACEAYFVNYNNCKEFWVIWQLHPHILSKLRFFFITLIGFREEYRQNDVAKESNRICRM